MYALNGLGNASKIEAIKAIRTVLNSGLRETKDWVENLPWKFQDKALAIALTSIGCLIDKVEIHHLFAVALWIDPKTGKWESHGEGWMLEGDLEQAKKFRKSSCEEYIYGEGLNAGQPLYWRFVEAYVPVPEVTEPLITGHALEE